MYSNSKTFVWSSLGCEMTSARVPRESDLKADRTSHKETQRKEADKMWCRLWRNKVHVPYCWWYISIIISMEHLLFSIENVCRTGRTSGSHSTSWFTTLTTSIKMWNYSHVDKKKLTLLIADAINIYKFPQLGDPLYRITRHPLRPFKSTSTLILIKWNH